LYAVVQYLSQSLIDHLRLGWRLVGMVHDHFLIVVPPQMRRGEMWYRGTADAVYQNLNLIRDFDPDLVAIFGADHIYRMDVSQMVDYHLDREADVTVAALPVPIAQASGFGIIEVDATDRIVGFDEKPAHPKPMPANPSHAYSSMGNYIFRRQVLVDALVEDARRSTDHDFGRTIIPEMVAARRVFAYNFLHNEIPGLRPYEERGYWRDVGTIQAYWQAHMDLLGQHPRFDLNNLRWPIHTNPFPGPPPRFVRGEVEDALLGEGTVIEDARVRHSILGRGVTVEPDAVIEESIVMDHTVVERGARLRRAVVDRFNVVEAGARIGYDPDRDARLYHLDPSGIVVLPRGQPRKV
ncbi:MAG: glucose-1-phosphate adenylyltransferase, partial [Armatimonadetes bacterium]|nr:glucose-1-phosphate adenylyltransferase [Armatimonadota bacterium]